jgi:hypothetical protein
MGYRNSMGFVVFSGKGLLGNLSGQSMFKR